MTHLDGNDVDIIQMECLDLIPCTPEDKILHLGCMHGKVSVKYLISSLQTNYDWFVAADISKEEDVFKGEKPHRSGQGILDLLDDDQVDKYQKCWNGFTKLLCFSSISWIKDPEKAMRNAFRILQYNGECAFTFVSRSSVYDAHKKLAENPHWTRTMKDYMELIPLSEDSEPYIAFRTHLETAGFTDVHCTAEQVLIVNPKAEASVFEHIQDVSSTVISTIWEGNKLDFIKDCAEAVPKEEPLKYELVIARARKAPYVPDRQLLKELIDYEDPQQD